MRLLVVSQYFWPENFRINDLTAEFAARGHQVTVLTGKPNYPGGRVYDEYRGDPRAFAGYEGARIVRVPMLARGNGGLRLLLNYLSFAISASILGVWKLRGEKFDAVFVYEPSPATVGIPGVVLRRFKRAPMAFWVLDLWPETLQAIGAVKSNRLLALVGWLVAFIYRRCDLILAQSRGFIPQIRRYAGAASRVEYFPSWAESVFQQSAVEPAAEVTPHAGFTVMFAGNIGEAQDFPAILNAAQALKGRADIRWLVLGDGRMKPWVEQEIASRGLQGTVLLLGSYPVERMPSFFVHADALLVSLKDEPIFAMTIPGKLQAYLAAGIPVLGMINGEGAELLTKSGAGLACAAEDSEGLTQAVLKLAQMSRQERQAMGQRGHDLYESEFDRKSLMDRAEGWLLDLANFGRDAA